MTTDQCKLFFLKTPCIAVTKMNMQNILQCTHFYPCHKQMLKAHLGGCKAKSEGSISGSDPNILTPTSKSTSPPST